MNRNTCVNLEEVSAFIEGLKEQEIPAILEYEEGLYGKLFYRHPKCGWAGIELMDGTDEEDSPLYCGLALSETDEGVALGMYGELVNGNEWRKLDIDDLSAYAQNAMQTSEFIRQMSGKCHASSKFDVHEDVMLKDSQMEAYLAKRKAMGAKLFFYN